MCCNGEKGSFIVFEGIDGSGSSTQARILYEKILSSNMQKVSLTSEPTNGPIGQTIRSIMQGRIVTCITDEMDDRLLAYLFAADRHDHLYNSVNGIVEKLERNFTVISTRYYLSSLAYHVGNSIDYSFVYDLNKNFPLPDITFYIDCPVDVSIERLKKRDHLEKYENKAKLEVVKKNYDAALEKYTGKLVILDGTDSVENLHYKICSTINLA